MRSRPLVVTGRSSRMAAAMCRAIVDAAGIGGTKRKIVGDTALSPVLVLEDDPSRPPTNEDVVLVTEGGVAPPEGVRLVVSDARCPDAAGTLYGLDDPTTPGWLGALVPPEPSGVQPFDVYAGGSYAGRFALAFPGEEGVRCALGALAATAEGFAVHVEVARRALAHYRP